MYEPKKRKMNTFILAQHYAERAGPHQDLYLEDGVNFHAYAIPKGVPTECGIKRLAIKVADHTPSEAMFEGEIASGYGKGTKEIIDEGTYLQPAPNILEFFGGRILGKYHLQHGEGKKYLIWRM